MKAHNDRARHFVSQNSCLPIRSKYRCVNIFASIVRFTIYPRLLCPMWRRPMPFASLSISSWFTWPTISHGTPNDKPLARMIFTGCLENFAGPNHDCGRKCSEAKWATRTSSNFKESQQKGRFNEQTISTFFQQLFPFPSFVTYNWYVR